jgi:hypothetical protein
MKKDKAYGISFRAHENIVEPLKQRLKDINNKRPYPVSFTKLVLRGIELALQELETNHSNVDQPGVQDSEN